MKDTKRIEALLTEQKNLTEQLEGELLSLSQGELSKENEALRIKLSDESAGRSDAETRLKSTSEKLKSTESALRETMLREKADVLITVNRRIDSYFISSDTGTDNRLKEHERACRNQIDALEKSLTAYGENEFSDIRKEIDDTRAHLDAAVAALEQHAGARRAELRAEQRNTFSAMREEDITEAEMKKSLGRKSVESFVGLNVINKIGILMLVVGALALGRFAYTKMGDTLKAALIFGLGALLIGAGELLSKKNKNDMFSQSFTGGGVAVLYTGTAVCLTVLDLFGATAAFILIAAVTALAYFLAIRHDSQIIACFASVGGYLPAVSLIKSSFDGSGFHVFILAIYFTAICILNLLVSHGKSWKVSSVIGFVLNSVSCASMFYLANRLFTFGGDTVAAASSIIFAAASFLIYTLVPLFHGKNRSFDVISAIILGGNAVFSFVLLSFIANSFLAVYAAPLLGTVPALFAAVYIPVLLSAKKQGVHTPANAILTAVSALSVMLLIPFTFGSEYAAASWFIEGACVLIYAIIKENKKALVTGLGVLAAAVPALIVSIFAFNSEQPKFFEYFTVCSAAVSLYAVLLVSAVYEKMNEIWARVISVAALSGGIIFACFMTDAIASAVTTDIYGAVSAVRLGVKILLCSCAVMLQLFVPSLKNKVTAISSAVCSLGLFVAQCVLCADVYSPVGFYNTTAGLKAICIVLMTASFAAAAFILVRTLKSLSTELNMPTELVPAIAFNSQLVPFAFLLCGAFNLRFGSPVISVIFAAAAAIMILFGFVKKYKYTRLSGLVLSFVSLGKLFLFDLNSDDAVKRIIAYFSFGALLIGVSYVYRHFDKELKNNNNDTPVIDKDEEVNYN